MAEKQFGNSQLVANLIKELGQDFFNEFAKEISNKKKVASGKLLKSLSFDIRQLLARFDIVFLAEDYLKYIISGRKKNLFAPPQRIKNWCKAKGIDTKYAYAINLKIYKFGIKPVDLITDVFERPQTLNEATQKIENVFANEVETNTVLLINQINKK